MRLKWDKRLLEFMASEYAKTLPVKPLPLMDPRTRKVWEVLKRMEDLEHDSRMRRRWRTLRRIVMWIITNDGAYRIRLLRLFREIARERRYWRLKGYEVRYWEK